jgi:nicotinamidase-related amidase
MPDRSTHNQSPAALLLIDVINHFEYPDSDKLLAEALPVAPRIAALKRRARAAGLPVIYVNDNFGQWRSDASKVLAYCLRPEAPSARFVEQLRPDDEDYFVLKPMHSGFYQTPLELLLKHLGVTTLILAGIATNSCIQYTAHDAKMRNFRIFVPPDCSAARTREEHDQAIQHMQDMASADVTPSPDLPLEKLARNATSRIATVA